MKIGKLIAYNIIIFIMMINTLFLYFGGGFGAYSFSKAYFTSIWGGLFMMSLLWIVGLLTNLSFIVSRALYKKNLLRISGFMVLVLTIVSIVGRIVEIVNGTFCGACWVQTVLYIVILVLTVLMLRDLHRLIRTLSRR